jgi:5-amino-6-(5-phosphoribosylamino)uracil reductase
VDGVRAGVDAILVGARTIRRDDAGLLVRAASLRQERVARREPESPIKVTLTAGGDLDPAARFFTTGSQAKIVYAASPVAGRVRARLADRAVVVDAGQPVDLPAVLADLAARGVRRLLVEGGGRVHAQFLAAGLADEIQLVIAPLFVADPAAPRFLGAACRPHDASYRMTLAEVRPIGDVVLLRYLPQRKGADDDAVDTPRA